MNKIFQIADELKELNNLLGKNDSLVKQVNDHVSIVFYHLNQVTYKDCLKYLQMVKSQTSL